jgi:hypothetical protein
MTLSSARSFALSLPETTESPHHHMSSFRVQGKIFATVPTDGDHLHIFVDELETKAVVAENPGACEELWWGKKLSGVRVTLSTANEELVVELLEDSWRMRAPKDALARFEEGPAK